MPDIKTKHVNAQMRVLISHDVDGVDHRSPAVDLRTMEPLGSWQNLCIARDGIRDVREPHGSHLEIDISREDYEHLVRGEIEHLDSVWIALFYPNHEGRIWKTVMRRGQYHERKIAGDNPTIVFDLFTIDQHSVVADRLSQVLGFSEETDEYRERVALALGLHRNDLELLAEND